MEPLVSTIEIARPPAEVFTFTTDRTGSPSGSTTW